MDCERHGESGPRGERRPEPMSVLYNPRSVVDVGPEQLK